MAINNPYVPGDPYSYDLKWMVEEVKKAQAVGAEAAASAEAAAASAEAASISEENAASSANSIRDTFITPEMFGAAGDGITDDTTALQNAIDAGFEESKDIYLTKNYRITNTLNVKGVRTTADAKGSQIIGNGFSWIIAGAAMNAVIEIIPATETTAYGAKIKNININGSHNAVSGIAANVPTSECIFEDITIKNCNNGMHFNGNCYLNSFKAIRPYNCSDYGILMENGNNTSNIFEKCYADSCGTAFKINGQYSTMISCCADNIPGSVFALTSFTGSLISCGSEATNASRMFDIGANSRIEVIGGMFFGNPNATGYYIYITAGSNLFIQGAVLNYMSAESSPGAFYYLEAQTHLLIKDCSIHKPFDGENYASNTAVLMMNSAIKTLETTVTVDSNGYAELTLNPRLHSILNISTSRSGWVIIPYAATQTRWAVKICGIANWTPTISDTSFPLTIRYLQHSLI